MIQSVVVTFEQLGRVFCQVTFYQHTCSNETIPEGATAPSVSDVKASDRFVDLWKRIGIQQLIPNSGFSQMPFDFYCPGLKAKVKNRVWKQCGIYYPSIAALEPHRQDGFGLEV